MEEFVGVTAKLYDDLIERNQHILIAGMTGSGKSVMLNGMINSVLYKRADKHQLLLIDLKRVEFSKYRNTAHCIAFAKTIPEIWRTLSYLSDLIEERFEEMEEKAQTDWDGPIIHVFVDEMAELMLKGKELASKFQSICEIGRAAGIQVICATQCPLARVIPTEIKVNFPIIVGLHTSSARHSRNILEVNGCENLPMYGEALIQYPTVGIKRVKVPMIDEEWLRKIIEADQRVEEKEVVYGEDK